MQWLLPTGCRWPMALRWTDADVLILIDGFY